MIAAGRSVEAQSRDRQQRIHPAPQPRAAPGPGARPGRPCRFVSRSFLVSAGERTGVAPLVATCFGPRTAAAGFTGRTWPTTSQSPSMRIRGQVLLHGRDRSRVALDVGGHVERRDVAQPEASRLAPPQELSHRAGWSSATRARLSSSTPRERSLVADELGPKAFMHERGGAYLADARRAARCRTG